MSTHLDRLLVQTVEQNDTLQTTALQIDDGKIVAIYVTRNPDKLRHLESHAVH